MAQKGLISMSDLVMETYEKLKREGYVPATIATNQEYQGARTTVSLSEVGVPARVADTVNLISAACSNEKHETIKAKAVLAVNEWLKTESDAWCLVLSGNKGCGKSSAAGWWLQNILKEVQGENNGYRSTCHQRWFTAGELSRWSRNFEEQKAKLNFLKVCNAIVIDDLGSEYADKNGYFNSVLDEIIDARYSNYKRTLITTNLNAAEFHLRYGDRVSDRIREGFKHAGPVGDTLFIEIPDKSMRG